VIVIREDKEVVTMTPIPSGYCLWIAVRRRVAIGIAYPWASRVGMGVYISFKPLHCRYCSLQLEICFPYYRRYVKTCHCLTCFEGKL